MDKVIFRMSDAGECPKALVAERLKYESTPIPSWLETTAEEGRWHEERAKKKLRKEGWAVEECEVCPACLETMGQERSGIHVYLEMEKFIWIGHLDGRISRDGQRKNLEVKSRSQFEFDRWMKDGFGGFPWNADQLTVYAEADQQSEWLYFVKNRNSGYEDRRFLNQAPSDIREIVQRHNLVVDCIQKIELPDIAFNPTSIQCRRCNFKKICLPEPKALSPVEESDLQAAVDKWRAGKILQADGKVLVGEAIRAFEVHTGATGIEKWRFDDLVVNTVHVKESVTYGKERLLEMFTEEQLKPAMGIKLPYSYIKPYDMKKESKEETGNAEMSE